MIAPTLLLQALPTATPFVAPERLARDAGFEAVNLLRLGANESGFGPAPGALKAAYDSLIDVRLYADSESSLLRERISLARSCTVDEVFVASGIDELLGLIVRAYLSPGDSVVTTRGSYPTFLYHVRGFGGTATTVEYSGAITDLVALAEAAAASKARLVYLANPDNPSGGFHPRSALTAFLRALPAQILLVLDEAYAEFADGAELLDAAVIPNVIRLRTFSKAYGLAGLRVGYALAAAELLAPFEKIRLHFGVSRPAQATALAALDERAYLGSVVAETARGRAAYAVLAERLGLSTYASATNFVLFELGSSARAEALVAELLARRVFVRKPTAGELASCIRVSVGTTSERTAFARHLAEALARVDEKRDV